MVIEFIERDKHQRTAFIPATCRDPNDDHVIAAAVAAKADCIVTDDRDLLDLGSYDSICMLSARAFLDEFGE